MREPEQIDIYYTAAVLIDQYGEGALLEATKNQEMYAAAGDAGSERIWRRIADAIESLQKPENLTGTTVQ
jgi:hypothetical protein